MQIAGIIAEYNPFHKGHAYHIQKTRELGATHVVAVMSGNYVQRGEPAIIDKWSRTSAALYGGVDLVLELPLPYVLSSAESFAQGAVGIFNALGCVDNLSFGSECGDVSLLKKAASAVENPETIAQLKHYLSHGITFARAREHAVKDIYGPEIAAVLQVPNNILAVEYLKALHDSNSKIEPITICRKGAGHDDQADLGSGFPSASRLRKEIFAHNCSFLEENLPPESCRILKKQIQCQQSPCDIDKLETAMLAALRRMQPSDYLMLADVSEGLENRLYRAVRSGVSLQDVMTKVKTKRYTLARIRRILLCAFLGIPKTMQKQPLPYLRVLGFNRAGQEILKAAGNTSALPILLKTKDAKQLNLQQRAFFDLECRSTDLYTLSMPQIHECAWDMVKGTVRLL